MRLVPSVLDPRRITGQIAILIVVSMLIVQGAIVAAAFLLRPSPSEHMSGFPLEVRFGTVVRLVAAAPRERRAETVADIDAAFPYFSMRLEPDVAAGSGASGRPEMRPERSFPFGQLHEFIGPGVSVAIGPVDAERRARVEVTFADGGRISAGLPTDDDGPPGRSLWLFGTLALLAVTLAMLTVWATGALTSPLRSFAAAAEGFSLDTLVDRLPESGPEEVRTVSRALNRMQDRIVRMVEDRTRMLAAVSHDLRTPITRMRLRAEFVADPALRAPILRDLDQMNGMIHGALSFLREGRTGEVAGPCDLAALVRTICDDFTDLGADVSFEGPDRLIGRAKPDELTRAVTNLVDNAVKYGVRASVRLDRAGDDLVIDISDEGPGIPEGRRAALLEPFVRGEEERPIEGQVGFGLGLSIASRIATAHGGRLALMHAEGGGLLCRLTIPVGPA